MMGTVLLFPSSDVQQLAGTCCHLVMLHMFAVLTFRVPLEMSVTEARFAGPYVSRVCFKLPARNCAGIHCRKGNVNKIPTAMSVVCGMQNNAGTLG